MDSYEAVLQDENFEGGGETTVGFLSEIHANKKCCSEVQPGS